jgi:hypothetical protein
MKPKAKGEQSAQKNQEEMLYQKLTLAVVFEQP